jgi:hypothetical protein
MICPSRSKSMLASLLPSPFFVARGLLRLHVLLLLMLTLLLVLPLPLPKANALMLYFLVGVGVLRPPIAKLGNPSPPLPLDVAVLKMGDLATGVGRYHLICKRNTDEALVGKSAWNSTKFRNYSYSGPFEFRNFHRNFIFPIVTCDPTNLEHVPTGSEFSPAVDSSNFMNRKTFPLYLSVASGIKF